MTNIISNTIGVESGSVSCNLTLGYDKIIQDSLHIWPYLGSRTSTERLFCIKSDLPLLLLLLRIKKKLIGTHWIGGFVKFFKTMGIGQWMELAKTSAYGNFILYRSLDRFYHHPLVSVCDAASILYLLINP